MHDFYKDFATTVNSGQSRSIMLTGNVHDLFWNGEKYVPLLHFLCDKLEKSGFIRILYQKNGIIKVLDQKSEIESKWNDWKNDGKDNKIFKQLVYDAIGSVTTGIEFLRQLTIFSRTFFKKSLLIFIEAADLLFPTEEISRLDDREKRRLCILQDWFSDPEFIEGDNSVCLLAESSSLIHPLVSRLPQVVGIEVPSPLAFHRTHYINHFCETQKPDLSLWDSVEKLADFTAGLSIYALRQLLKRAVYTKQPLSPNDVVGSVEKFIQLQLGEDVVEFHKPAHRLKDCIGCKKLVKFLQEELIPRFKAPPDKALSGAAVAGPLGSGKTYVFEAVAAELDIPVLVLKQIRSQWFGQTDVILERLQRVLKALNKVLIFVDEADTQLGNLGQDAHETERRLTGKIQAMMSDSRMRGKVIWLLMTARIHLLSPDLRRPGRVGDLIIPVLDPEGEDRKDFIRWMLKDYYPNSSVNEINLMHEAFLADINRLLPADFSAASFASLRADLKVRLSDSWTSQQIKDVIADHIPPAIQQIRRYQTLQALVNCTRKSLLPDPNMMKREKLLAEIIDLERKGIK